MSALINLSLAAPETRIGIMITTLLADGSAGKPTIIAGEENQGVFLLSLSFQFLNQET